ncbi:TIGR00180 family glycosyltransferase [Fodinicurvata sp. EGI_FJ10296]|uniref:TIGR00180 family glycosyltransferase n=1 Tax=Fodinicurvata sp. EGI_FJ10296 TaxID=3231908 RepID=UPI0034560F30
MQQFATCIIPTRNRLEFMRRTIHFLETKNKSSNIIIADSSDGEICSAITAIVDNSILENVIILHFEENIGFYEKINATINQVKTKYLYFMADDDFIFLSGVLKCVEELEHDKTLAAAAGTVYVYNLSGTGPHSKYLPHSLSTYPQKSELIEDRLLRSINHIEKYSATFYSVYRLDCAQKAFGEIARRTGHMRLAEIFSSAYVLTTGRRRIVDGTFGLRTSHDQAGHRTIVQMKDEYRELQFVENFSAALAGLVQLAGKDTNHKDVTVYRTLLEACAKYLRRVGIGSNEVQRFLRDVSRTADSALKWGTKGALADHVSTLERIAEPAAKLQAGTPEIDEMMFAIGLCELAPLGINHGVTDAEFEAQLQAFFDTLPVASFRQQSL